MTEEINVVGHLNQLRAVTRIPPGDGKGWGER